MVILKGKEENFIYIFAIKTWFDAPAKQTNWNLFSLLLYKEFLTYFSVVYDTNAWLVSYTSETENERKGTKKFSFKCCVCIGKEEEEKVSKFY